MPDVAGEVCDAEALLDQPRDPGSVQCSVAKPCARAPSTSILPSSATPYVNRAAMLGMQDLWANRPKVAGWFERMQKRASFAPAVTAWLTDADRERFAAPPDEARHKLRAILNLP